VKPRFIDIDGRRYLWHDIVQLRREQLAVYAQMTQPTLFQLLEDHRPATLASAADRYLEPSLFDA